ncbi:hypothetical protein BC936DRAFT_142377 [Jimgerdemannia flammicorona]|uniref:Uncharacterized protein n=1 Tax=Jimgerdemannia flammicorona TaxID=994334 RepID=A0A433A0S0_9FUNG|nr:hypothetical protein BC936DRAFT_142377 [Jimgerdemannia flammicorona]
MLADYSLVRRTTRKDSEQDDPGKDTLSIHRLVQAAILSKIKLPEKKEMCKRLLSALFHEMKPKNERSVEAYVPHVRHLIEQIMQWAVDGPDIEKFSQWAAGLPNFSKELMSLLPPTVVYLTSRHLFEGVENLAKLAVLISKMTNETWHPDTATALSNLSYFYGSRSQFEDAERPCELAWQIRRRILGHSDKGTISTVHYLAFIYQRRHMEGHATQLYWEAATIGDYDAQRLLSIRYREGIGAPINEKLAQSWERQSRQGEPNLPGVQPSSSLNENLREDFTPLHQAGQQNNLEVITNNITEYKRFANAKDRNGQTPLHVAAKYGKYEVAKIMVNELNVDVGVNDYYGQTPMHLAVESRSMEIIKLLNEFGSHAELAGGGYQITIEICRYEHQKQWQNGVAASCGKQKI